MSMKSLTIHISAFLLVLLTYANCGFSQDTITDPDFIDIPANYIPINDVPNRNAKKSKVNYHMEAGMNYSISSNGYGGPGYFLSPSANYDATDRLSLSVGTGFAYQQFQNYTGDGNSEMTPIMTYFIYTQGTYRLSDNVIVDGSVTYARNDVPNRNKQGISDNSYQKDITGYSFGLTYRLKPNVTFGIHFDYSNSPYNRYNAYGQPYMSPFYNSLTPFNYGPGF